MIYSPFCLISGLATSHFFCIGLAKSLYVIYYFVKHYDLSEGYFRFCTRMLDTLTN